MKNSAFANIIPMDTARNCSYKVQSESTMAMDDVSCFCHINRCAIEFFSVAVAMIECMMGRCSMIW